MSRKIIFSLIVILILVVGGGFFWWWQNQKDVRELNKGLPEGVRVVKSLFGEYKVVNKLDGYEVKVPREWEGLKEIEYTPERKVKELEVVSVNLTGENNEFIAIDCYRLKELGVDLEAWANELIDYLELSGILKKEIVGNLEVVKMKEEEHLAGIYIYFLKKDLKIYAMAGFSEESIREIILNGRW